jgi:acyl-CoA hydrolase
VKQGKPEDVLDWLKPGTRAIVQGATGEPLSFIDAFKAAPERAANVDLWACLVPGINTFDYGALHPQSRFTTFMASPAWSASLADGRTQLRAMPYSGIGETLARTDFDLAILHVSPPDDRGLCSFGVCCDVGAIVWPRARRRIAYVNASMPRLKRADAMPFEAIDLAIPVDAPLIAAPFSPPSADLAAIGRHVAALIPDGAAIQSGIGQAPGAAIAALANHRRLSAHSGLITADYRALAKAGAIDSGAANVAGIAYGDAGFYDWLAASDFAAFRSIPETHGPAGLAATPNFHSINSAIEIDLSGAINIEFIAGKRVSSVGGAPDYVRGAVASRGGRSIIALPSKARSGASRILPALRAGETSFPAELADTIVTEHGVAELKGKSRAARAEALIAIAAPEHRGMLAAAI